MAAEHEHKGGGQERKESQAYAKEVSKAVVSHVCHTLGFSAARSRPMDALADLLERFLFEAGSKARELAEICGRSEPHAGDAVEALRELRAPPAAIAQFIVGPASDAPPLGVSLPNFPLRKRPKLKPSFKQAGEEPPEHVPPFLPTFPDERAYSRHKSEPEGGPSASSARARLLQDRRAAESSLLALTDRIEEAGTSSRGQEQSLPGRLPEQAEFRERERKTGEAREEQEGQEDWSCRGWRETGKHDDQGYLAGEGHPGVCFSLAKKKRARAAVAAARLGAVHPQADNFSIIGFEGCDTSVEDERKRILERVERLIQHNAQEGAS